jgi:hypothetical protein
VTRLGAAQPGEPERYPAAHEDATVVAVIAVVGAVSMLVLLAVAVPVAVAVAVALDVPVADLVLLAVAA